MPTLTGPWEGGSVKGRIKITYTRTYINNNTDVNFAGDINIEFDQSISDSTNTWVISGDGPNSSGSNLAISFGSGGGTKKIRSFDDNTGYVASFDIATSVSNLEAIGTTVNATLSLPLGNLAPYLNNSGYSAVNVTSSACDITNISYTSNGTSVVETQVEYNTAPSDSGASYISSTHLTGLYRATLYYFRVRVRNSGYGWSQWGGWQSFTTLSTTPGAPSESFLATNIGQTTADIGGLSVPDNGGAALDQILVRVNTTPVDAGASDFTGGGGATSIAASGLLPGTLYYYRVIAHNGNGYSPWTSWKSFTTLPGVSVKVGGAWKNAQPYVKVGGIWKPAVRYVKVSGAWKQ